VHPRSRPGIWLSALVIAVIQVGGSYGAGHNQPLRKPIDAVAVALLLVGPAALAWRDRWPVSVAAVASSALALYVGLGYPYGRVFLSTAVALFTAVQYAPRVRAWAVAAFAYVGFTLAYAFGARTEHVGWEHLVVGALFLAALLAAAELVKVRREQMAERFRAAEEEKRARLGEQRLGLAQELHDVLAHNISLINVQASVALHLLDEQPAQARPALTTIKAASHDALQELRTALDLLRLGDDAPRTPAPQLGDLDALVRGVRAGGLDVQLVREGEAAPLPAAVELAAFRIVQEALTNVTRHANATSVSVRVRHRNGDGVDVEVLDDGVGGGAAAGNGITGMRERAAALGGYLEVGPAAGRGFRVAAHLPAESP
jgi:signal transduction histidine kinase